MPQHETQVSGGSGTSSWLIQHLLPPHPVATVSCFQLLCQALSQELQVLMSLLISSYSTQA